MTYSYKVVRPFVDKEDGKEYKLGNEFPTDITSEPVSYTHLTLPTNREV